MKPWKPRSEMGPIEKWRADRRQARADAQFGPGSSGSVVKTGYDVLASHEEGEDD